MSTDLNEALIVNLRVGSIGSYPYYQLRLSVAQGLQIRMMLKYYYWLETTTEEVWFNIFIQSTSTACFEFFKHDMI